LEYKIHSSGLRCNFQVVIKNKVPTPTPTVIVGVGVGTLFYYLC